MVCLLFSVMGELEIVCTERYTRMKMVGGEGDGDARG